MRRWKIILPAALILLVVLVLVRAPKLPEAKLPDGTIVEVTAVTFGTNHSYSSSSRWQHWLHEMTPRRWRNLTAPGPSRTIHTETDSVIIWLRHTDPRARTFRPVQDWHWQVVDQHGCPFHVVWTRGGPTNQPLDWVTAAAYPRRERTFRLVGRLKSDVVSFEIRNPRPVQPTEWQPERWPATRRVGEVELSLTGFKGTFVSNVALSYLPTFEFRRNGQARSNEFSTESIFVDATGNRARHLCPFEPAWKVETTLFPSAFADFPAGQIVPLGRVQNPRPAETATLALNEKARALGIFYVGFTGAGQFTLSNSVWAQATTVIPNKYLDMGSSANSSDARRGYWQRQMRVHRPTLWLVTSNATVLEKYLVRARDQEGRIYPDRNNSRRCSHEDRIAFRNSFFALPDDAREIELELVPFQSQPFEFVVRPPMVPAGGNR
jgi:hypothetical protein